MRETQSQSPLNLKALTKFVYNTVHIILTENRMNNEYRSLTNALEVVGCENAMVRCKILIQQQVEQF